MIEMEHGTNLNHWITGPCRKLKNVSSTIETGELATVLWSSPRSLNIIPRSREPHHPVLAPPVTPNLSRRDHPLVNEYAAAAHILGT